MALGGTKMDWSNVFGHNIYIDDELVGYISSDHDGGAILFVGGRQFAELDNEGIIYIQGREVGYIDDNGELYIVHKLMGEVDAWNDIRLYGDKLKV